MHNLFLSLSVIVVLSALLAWSASRIKQPIFLGYLVCGILAGPVGFGFVTKVELVSNISQIGVTLLLFLAGLVLHPSRLRQLFRSVSLITVVSALINFLMVFTIVRVMGFTSKEAAIASAALMFSSTILVIKLMPTTTLHQKHMGATAIAVLIAQDIIAVVVLLFISAEGEGSLLLQGLFLQVKAAILIAIAAVVEQYVIRKMMHQAERYREVVFMLCLAWCLGLASIAHEIGLSAEIGAFIAGVTMARSPFSRFLSEELKLIRDFFLMFFFFVMGARLDVSVMGSIWLPALVLTAVVLLTRPYLFRVLLQHSGETGPFSKELGVRLGQASEFGLIIAYVAGVHELTSKEVTSLIKLVIILTMAVSSYYVVFKYPNPLATTSLLKKD